ncbi:MAG TPA: S4 domain-containing protein [Steroidobacteraceae bacterium]|jgi:23S rRNA pseudouridine2605 synthase|nr:S4 domain-containing protein [Steroidobacteraceae bacterium]
MSERLNKVLAQHGIGSRREVERWITEGRLELNGKQVKLGDRYEEGDRVSLDGRDVTRRLQSNAPVQVFAYHKPQGQLIERSNVSSEDNLEDVDTGETVMDRLPKQRGVRWVPINPMHAGDSGLLLLTNDGKLSYALTRQKKNIPTVYMVRVHVRGGVNSAPQLSTRLLMDNDVIEFTSVEASGGEGDNVWYKVTMPRADRRAAVRALFASNGLTVSRMMQVAFAEIELTKDLPRSRHQLLKPAQVERLYEAAQLKVERSSSDSVEKVRNSAKTDPVKRTGSKVKLKRAATGATQGKRRVSTPRPRSSRK